MVSEDRAIKAINHVLGVMDRRGYEQISKDSREAYDILYFLREGLEGDTHDGSRVVFYKP